MAKRKKKTEKTRQSVTPPAAASAKTGLPGTIYLNKNRYWWKVRLPGELKKRARPLKAVGAKYATTELPVAIEIAKKLYEAAIFQSETIGDITDQTNLTTMSELARAYLQYCDDYYRDNTGNVTREPQDIRYTLKPLIERWADLHIHQFGPLKLIELRNHFISLDWSRSLINQRIGRIKRMFKWAVSRQIVSPVVYQGLMAVEGLKQGRSGARESKPVLPVDEKLVYAIFPYTTLVVANMLELLLFTGMRPGELVIMRPCDIDRSGKIWHYKPVSHKTQYRGKERVISIGPKGQKILLPYLLREAESFCFTPADSERQRRAKLTENRKTPLSCGNTVGSKMKKMPTRKPGEVYDTNSFRKAAKYAMTACRKEIRTNGGDANKEMPYWTLYQLRHTAATKVRKEFGYESAGATLGHTKMSATEIYAERNQGLADEAARRLG